METTIIGNIGFRVSNSEPSPQEACSPGRARGRLAYDPYAAHFYMPASPCINLVAAAFCTSCLM